MHFRKLSVRYMLQQMVTALNAFGIPGAFVLSEWREGLEWKEGVD